MTVQPGSPARVPPHDNQAEQAVLGGVLLHNQALNQVLTILEPEDLYRETHRLILKAMMDLVAKGEPVDLVTLTAHMRSSMELERVGGASYLSDLVDRVATTANIDYYAKIVREKATIRKLLFAAAEIVTKGYEEIPDVDDFVDQSQRSIFQVTSDRARRPFSSIAEILPASMAQIQELHVRKSAITGVATGFERIDMMTGGFQPSDLIIIAGRPSMGKTAFCLNLAQHAAVRNNAVTLVFSLEMSKEQIVHRLLCSEARINFHKIRKGELVQEDWGRLGRAAERLQQAKIFIDDTPSMTTTEMQAKARRLMAEHGLNLIAVDYIQLMRSPGRTENREREISDISRSLKALAKDLSIPVIGLSQLNRSLENRPNKRPQMSDLRESGALEQDADVIGFIYRDEVYHEDSPDKGIAEFIIGKQRNGPIGTVRLKFFNDYTKFDNLADDGFSAFSP